MDNTDLNNHHALIAGLMDLYAHGVFPMADGRGDVDAYWVDPPMRGVIPLDRFNVPRSLRKFMDGCDYNITVNQAFDRVIESCAENPRKDKGGTWINHDIEAWFKLLHRAGHAHSVEVWGGHGDRKGDLIGGLYGLAQGGCFNGESMFSTQPNASKCALVYLVDRLKQRGFSLLDTQFVNDHLRQFGCIEIPKDDYIKQLQNALQQDVSFV